MRAEWAPKETLELSFDQAGEMYLRGFVGAEYDGKSWKQLPNDAYTGKQEGMLEWLLEQGYQLVTVSELLTLRFRQEVQTNHLYGYSLFRWQVPPLAETPVTPEAPEVLSAEPVSKAPIKVKLVLRETVPGESVRTELLGKDLLSLQARRL